MKIMPLLLCAFILIGCASPQSNRPFAKRKQAMNAFQKRFQALDVNGNGELSRTEFSKSQAAQRSADSDNLFKSADTSGDGVLTIKELQQALRKLKLNRN
jgi:Ca2+-binding EF-hand superfamily protein